MKTIKVCIKTLRGFIILLIISKLFDASVFASDIQTAVAQGLKAGSLNFECEIVNVERNEESVRAFSAKSFSLPYANVYVDTGLKFENNDIQTLLETIYSDLELLFEKFTKDYYRKPLEIWILQFDLERGKGFAFSFEDSHGRVITNESFVLSKDYLRPIVEIVLDRKIPVLSYGLVAYFNEANQSSRQDGRNINPGLLSFFPFYFHQEYAGAEISDHAYFWANDFINFLLRSNTGQELIQLFVEDSPLICEKQGEWFRELGIAEPEHPFWTDICMAIADPAYDFALETERIRYHFQKNFIQDHEMTDEQRKLRDSGFFCLTAPSDIENFVDTNLSLFHLLIHKLGEVVQDDAALWDWPEITYLVSETRSMQAYYDSTATMSDDNKVIIRLGSPIYYAHIHELVHSLLNPAAAKSWGKELEAKDLQRYVYLSEGLACYLSTQIHLAYIAEHSEHSKEMDPFYDTGRMREVFLEFKDEQDKETFAYKIYNNYLKKGGVLSPEVPLDYHLLEEAKVLSAFAEDPELEDERFAYLYYESWMKYMADSYGLSPVIQAFTNNQDFYEAFGMSFEESLAQWKIYIKKGIRRVY